MCLKEALKRMRLQLFMQAPVEAVAAQPWLLSQGSQPLPACYCVNAYRAIGMNENDRHAGTEILAPRNGWN